MWARQYEQARWNGIAFNVLKTSNEEGKRIQAKEMANSDDHYIDVLGDKIPKYSLEAVFVGENSLQEANAFRTALRKTPTGTLEHPYLGVLDLVYETSSQSISTKIGLVTLSISFVSKGKPIELPQNFAKSLDNYTDPVIEQANVQFESQVKASNVDQLNTIKEEFGGFLSDMDAIANQLPNTDLQNKLSQQANAAMRSVNTISANPKGFAEQVGSLMNNAADSISQSGNATSMATTIDKRLADNEQKGTALIRLHSTTTRLKLNKSLSAVTDSANLSDLTSRLDGKNLTDAQNSINTLQQSLNDRYMESSASAEYDTWELVNALSDLKQQVQNQAGKLTTYQAQIKNESVYSPTPALYLAYANDSSLDEFNGLNSVRHPLFVQGQIKVKR
ncbi:MAG: DNA circularization N-terminal domain-containing protein [Hydrogenovibrio crunogenus]|nr:DNA circularization N-terminal domain-containing protein [Hydrogenovibrio crunogenus]